MGARTLLRFGFLCLLLCTGAVSPAACQEDAATHFHQGVALHKKGDLDGAIAEYREALRLQPNYPEAHYNLALALDKKGDLDGAIAEFREALRLQPNFPAAHYNLGVALYEKGDLDGAIAEFREALRLQPNFPAAHYNLGVAFDKKGDLDGAIAEFREALRLQPDNLDARNNLGVALYEKGDLDGAIAEYREALRLRPDDPEAHYNLGVAFAKKGDLDGAIVEYRETLRLRPNFPAAHYNLGMALMAKGEKEEAAREFAKAQQLDPKLHPPTSTTATAPTTGAEGEKRFYANDLIGIRILLPLEWQVTKELKGPANQSRLVFLGQPGMPAQVTLGREVREATPEMYNNLVKMQISRAMQDYRELGEENISQGGLEGRKITLSFKANGITQRMWMLVFSKGEDHFSIMATALEEYFDRYQSTFQEMLDSVEFIGLAPERPSATESMTEPTATQYAGKGTGQIISSPAAEVARLREKVAQNPDDYVAHMELGNALDDSGDTDAAIAEYTNALRLNPDFPLTHGNLGASYIRKEDWKAAEAALREAVRLDPDYFMAHFRLVYVLVQQRDSQGAFNEYREVNRIDREQAQALMFKEFPGLAQIPGAQQEIAATPPDAVAHFYIAIQLRQLRRKDCRAWIRELEEAVRIAPKFTLARSLRNEGRQECR